MNNNYTKTCGDVDGWVYSETVKDHFFNPRNILMDKENGKQSFVADGVGTSGSPECGDVLTVWIKVDKETGRIKECRWRTFGCATAIASSSMMSVMATEGGGMDLVSAQRLKPEQIVDRLGGIPDRKFHCSVLGHEALRNAVLNFLENAK